MTKLALVLGGGASLGTYVGGAVSEILSALERNRRSEPVTVEVISGSSAGALTAALAARALTVNPTLLPWIEKAWVEAVDARTLLNPDRNDRSALLDVELLDELTRALVAGPAAEDDRPSAALGETLRVGLSLSNLQGIPFDFRFGFLNVRDRRYGARIYSDWIDFHLSARNRAGDPIWESLRQAALASASFPFLFPPRPLARSAGEYPGAHLPEGEVTMWYSDGGLFDNQPLDLAKRLVDRSDSHRSADWRYILVDPTMLSREFLEPEPGTPPTSAGALASDIVTALLGENAARDWRGANKVNARLDVLQALVDRLPEINDRLDDPEAVALGRYVGELAERVAEMKVAVRRGPPSPQEADPVVDYLDGNLERIQSDPRFRSAFRRPTTRAGRTRLAKLVFLLEAIGGLRGKEPLALYLVAPRRADELAGRHLGGFAGFFDREWRTHDFRSGRQDARTLLTGALSDLVDYEPEEIADGASPPDAGEDILGSLPSAARRRLEAYLDAEARRWVGDLDLGLLGRLTGWAWKPVVRRQLVEQALSILRRAG